ncbi:MAG: hypothetical protein ABIH56_07395 [Candidatus Margulisiibacteriota bacterium]
MTFIGDGSQLSGVLATGIADYAVTTSKIATAAVTSEKLAADLTFSNLTLTGVATATAFVGDGSQLANVVATDIADNAVSTSKISDESVTSAKILDETIQTIDIGDSQVTNVKLAGGITEDKLNAITAAGKVSGASLSFLGNIPAGAGTIPNANLNIGTGANQLVTLNDLGQLPTIDASNLTNVTATNVPDYSITETKIATDAVTTEKLAGSIPDSKLAAITTAGKVDGSALTSFANIPGDAGVVPSANLPIGFAAGQLVTLDAEAKLPAIDGSRLTGIPGQANTASNVGSAGVGLYKQKTGADLEFYKINSASNKLTIGLVNTDHISLEVNEANLTLSNMAGTLGIAHGGTGLTAAPAGGQLLIGNGTGYTIANLNPGDGIVISNGVGSVAVSMDISDLPIVNSSYLNDYIPLYTGSSQKRISKSDLFGDLLGALKYKDTWNADANTPTLLSSTGEAGNYYVVNVAGSTELGGITTWAVNDWAIYNGSTWQRIQSTNTVASVFGRTGPITAQPGDYTPAQVGLGNVSNEAQIPKSLGTTKGDLIVYNGNGTPDRLLVGTNGQVLKADSSEPTGVKWDSAAAGTVSSVGLSLPSQFNVVGSPVTSSGTIIGSWQSQTAHYVLAAPVSSSGTPEFRALVASDIPTLNQNTTGTSSNVTGTVAIVNGGTGQTTRQNAINALTDVSGASTNNVLAKDGGGNASFVSIGTLAVPYTGATSTVNLGAQQLSTSGLGTFGSVKSGYVYPAADSSTGFQVRRADGSTSVVNVNTTASPSPLLSLNGSASNITIANPNDGAGLILAGYGGGTNGQLRIVSNNSAWSDNQQTAYFQIKSGTSENYATFMGGTYGSDAPFYRLQFNSDYTTITDNIYTSTPVPTALFEVVGNTAAKEGVKIKGASGQTADLLKVQNNAGTDLVKISSGGYVGIATDSPGAPLDVKGAIRLSGAASGYVGLAPAAAAGSTTYTLPSADGANKNVLATNGSGLLTWTSTLGALTVSGLNMSNAVITNVSTPVAGSDAVNKWYVDNNAGANLALSNLTTTAINTHLRPSSAIYDLGTDPGGHWRTLYADNIYDGSASYGIGTLCFTTKSQTLTNKTLTSPTINTATISGGTISGSTINNAIIGGSAPAAGTFTTLTANGAINANAGINITGTVTATAFSGNGANLTSLNAGNISSGILPVAYGGSARGAGGIAGNQVIKMNSGGTQYDSAGTAPTGAFVGTTDIQTLTNKTLTSPTINTATISGGTINNAIIGGSAPAAGTFTTLTANGAINANAGINITGTVTATAFSGNGANLSALNAGNISSGTLAIARGGTNATSFTASQLVRMNSGGTALESSGKTVPTGTIVGDSDSQTLTNKTMSTGSTWNGNTVAANYGGTGQSSYATGDILYATGTTTLAKRAVGSTGQLMVVRSSAPSWETFSDSKSGVFIQPGVGNSANIRLPFNATITGVYVFCEGGTNVTGVFYNNGSEVGTATATPGIWGNDATLNNTAYTSGNTLRFYIAGVTGGVTSASITVYYTKS